MYQNIQFGILFYIFAYIQEIYHMAEPTVYPIILYHYKTDGTFYYITTVEHNHHTVALWANPFPKVTDLFCRLPLPTCFYSTRGCSPWRPDAVVSTTSNDVAQAVSPIFTGHRYSSRHTSLLVDSNNNVCMISAFKMKVLCQPSNHLST